MLRYMLKLPKNMSAREAAELQIRFAELVDAPDWRDILVSEGIQVTDLRLKRPRRPYRPALLR